MSIGNAKVRCTPPLRSAFLLAAIPLLRRGLRPQRAAVAPAVDGLSHGAGSEPAVGNAPVMGFDVASDAVRRASLQQARDTGMPVATGQLTLLQQRDRPFILGNISLAKMFAGANAPIVPRLSEAEQACQQATALTQQLFTFAIVTKHDGYIHAASEVGVGAGTPYRLEGRERSHSGHG